MLKLDGVAVGETPTFAAIVKDTKGIEDVLFEEWEPVHTGLWAQQIFTPFKWDGEEERRDPEETVEAELGEPEYLGGEVHTLQDKQVQSA